MEELENELTASVVSAWMYVPVEKQQLPDSEGIYACYV